MSVYTKKHSKITGWALGWGSIFFRPSLNPVKSLTQHYYTQNLTVYIWIIIQIVLRILNKATKNHRWTFHIRDRSTCKGMKSWVKLPTLSGPKYCLLCWQEKNGLVVDLCCQKAREWNRDHSTVMKQRGPCAHTQCDNVRFECVSRRVTSLTLEVSSVSSNSASIQKLKFAVGTVTQHLQWRGQRPVVQRGVPFYALKTKLLTLGQRANDPCYRQISVTWLQGDRDWAGKDIHFSNKICCI